MSAAPKPTCDGFAKSSYSVNGSECVEVRIDTDAALVRDTKNRAAATLSFGRTSWATFLTVLPPTGH